MPKITQGSKEKDDGGRDSNHFIQTQAIHSSIQSLHLFIHSRFVRSSPSLVIHSYTFIPPSLYSFIHTQLSIHPSVPPFIHFIHPLRTLHKIVLQEMTTTTENTARHKNTTKLGLKTTDKSCKAALLNEKLRVLDDEDDAAVPLVWSPLLTSFTKSKLPPFLLKSWMFLLSTCSQQQQSQQHPWGEKKNFQHNNGKSQKSSSTSSNHGTVNDPSCKISLSLSLSLSLGFFSLRYGNKREPDKKFFLLASFLPHRVRTVASGRLRRWRQ